MNILRRKENFQDDIQLIIKRKNCIQFAFEYYVTLTQVRVDGKVMDLGVGYNCLTIFTSTNEGFNIRVMGAQHRQGRGRWRVQHKFRVDG